MRLFCFSGFCTKVLPLFLAGALLVSCDPDSSPSDKVDFDRKAMLTHWADNILLPAFADYQNQVDALNTSVGNYLTGSVDLNQLRQQFKDSYLAFQRIKAFEVGPSSDVSFRASLNTYPSDTTKIADNITNRSYNLGSASQLDARGYPAMDFVLYGNSVDLTTQDARDYLNALMQDILSLSQNTTTAWVAYREKFINASGTDIGSSLGQMVNSINKDYEIIKNAKIGFPAGKKTLGTPYPHTCEAFFGGFSIELTQANLEAIHNFFLGIHFDGSQNGQSLDDYLIALDAKHMGNPLDQAIDEQFRKAENALALVPGKLSEAVVNHIDEVDAAYLEIQRNVVLLKTDMPSSMGVLITYQDNDGD